MIHSRDRSESYDSYDFSLPISDPYDINLLFIRIGANKAVVKNILNVSFFFFKSEIKSEISQLLLQHQVCYIAEFLTVLNQ